MQDLERERTMKPDLWWINNLGLHLLFNISTLQGKNHPFFFLEIY